MGVGSSKKSTRKRKTRKQKQRGGGGAMSKPAPAPAPAPSPAPVPEPIKRIVLFDIDSTLLFRTEVYGIWSLQQERERAGLAAPGETYAITADKIRPRPDVLFTERQEIVYVRPGALEALDIARTAVSPENVHIFTASSNPGYVLTATGIADKINMTFDRKWTEVFLDRGSFMALKDLAAVRKSLGLKPTDIVYLFDDKPEWVKNVSSNDRVIAVPAFTPAYELYGVSKTHDIVSDPIPHETTLSDIVRAQLA